MNVDTTNKQIMANKIMVENHARSRAQLSAITAVCLCATLAAGVGTLIV